MRSGAISLTLGRGTTLALEGIKVIDLTWQGPGPYCTFIMGDLGAEVIRITAPPTAGARQVQRKAGEREVAYQAIHRNKKSLRLNLKSAEGHKIFTQLVEQADVIVEGYRPGVAKRLGIDYPAMAEVNRRLVYCSITGYGQDGPYRDLSGHDINYISFAGALDLIGEPDRPPVRPLNLLGDYAAGGIGSVVGILSALIARGKTGRGQYVDISMTDGIISMLADIAASHYFESGVPLRRGESYSGGGYPFCNQYQTKDGGFITIACLEPWFWENLCRAIGKEEYIPYNAQCGLDRADKKWSEISAYLSQLFLTKTRDEWFNLLSKKDVPIGKVYSIDEVFTDPQVLHRKMVIEVEHPTEGKVKQVGIAIKLSDTPGAVRSLAPMPGEHTEEILAGLGYDKSAISTLQKEGVIG
ncbi:MAG: CaiB/BaiF CoA-transferase family protein [Chloroflexota bacterium]